MKNQRQTISNDLFVAFFLKCSFNFFSLSEFSPPLGEYPFYLLLETSGSNLKHDDEKLSTFLEKAMDRGLVLDGVSTNEPSKIAQIWDVRELAATAEHKDKYYFKYDISVPLKHYYDIVPALRERFGDIVEDVYGFGHMGDSNIHLNVKCDSYSEKVHKLIEPFIYEFTTKHKGSISAEHGIGFEKKEYLKVYKQKEALDLMKQLKMVMDPNGILNPYKVLSD